MLIGQVSMPKMTGRPGHRTLEMIGGSSALYLARTPCVPLFCTLFNKGGSRRAFRLPGAGGGSFPLYGGTFVRSYSVPKVSVKGRLATVRFSSVRFVCGTVQAVLVFGLDGSSGQRRRDDNKNKICVFEGGGGIGGREENRPKTLFFLGNAMAI